MSAAMEQVQWLVATGIINDLAREIAPAIGKAVAESLRADVQDAMLRLIEADPHLWSQRPCQTCTAVSALAGRAFGCVAKAAK